MQFPKISIVTPSFNQGEFLEETILSVLEQNYPNLEYIIIDGGSSDRSVEIIRKYENRLTYWVSEPDRGIYDAIAKGFEKSTGEIMAWINSDDMYHRKAFLTIAEIFSRFKEVNWLQGNPSSYDEQGRTVAVGPQRLWSKYNFYSNDFQWIQQESCVWRRSLWERAGRKFSQQLRYAGDFELWLRFFRHEKLYITDALIGGFRLRSAKQISLDNLEPYLKEVQQCILNEVLGEKELDRMSKIRFCKKLLDFTERLEIGSLKLRYYQLFEYPPHIQFNRTTQNFELSHRVNYQLISN